MFFTPRGTRHRGRVVVLGAGEVGYNVADRLARENRQVVVVDRDPESVARIQKNLDVQAIHGWASSPDVLELAGIADADIVVAVTGNDEVNLLACLIANMKNPASTKLARVRNEAYSRFPELYAPGCTHIQAIINPDIEVVHTMLRMLVLPQAVDYGEFGNGRIKVVALDMEEGDLIGQPLTRFRSIAGDSGMRVGGIMRHNKLLLANGTDTIQRGDIVYFVCLEESLSTLLSVCRARAKPIRHICIVGGGEIGYRLAARLDNQGHRVKLVEQDRVRCAELADKLSQITILHGDGTDREFMQEESIGDMDMVAALTGDEETNILTSLMAKTLGAENTITRINKSGYMPIVRAVGLRLSVNPRLAATNSIVKHLHQGLLLSTLTTHDEEVEMLEARVGEGSKLAGKALKDAVFPPGVNLLALMRGDTVSIPDGTTVLQAADRVTLICLQERLDWLDSVLSGTSGKTNG